jgi:hypothetical protein
MILSNKNSESQTVIAITNTGLNIIAIDNQLNEDDFIKLSASDKKGLYHIINGAEQDFYIYKKDARFTYNESTIIFSIAAGVDSGKK